MEEKEMTIDLLSIAKYVLSKIVIVLLVTVLFAAVAFIYTELYIPRKYTSYTDLYVVNTMDSASTVSASDLSAAEKLASAYSKFLKSNTTLTAVSKRISNSYSVKELTGMVDVSTDTETEILRISVTCESRNDAQKIADLVAEEGEKEITRIVKSGSVSVVDPATEAQMTSPNVMKNTLVAGAAGFIVVVVILALISVLDKRIKTKEQLEELFEMDVIGVIPTMNGGDKNE